jgi:putative transposase
LGKLKVKAHVYCTEPKSLTISLESNGRWFVSFCCELPAMECQVPSVAAPIIRSQEELMYEFALRDDLAAISVGLDRGVAIPVASSNDQPFDIDPVCRKRIAKKERYIKRFQRRMAKQTKGSCNYRKNQKRIAKLKGYGADVRKDFAHKASHTLTESSAQIFVFEDLKLQNMTKAPKAKVDSKGRYTKNGAAAKAGLNKVMLASALGLVKQFTAYKAANKNKLVLSVPAHHTSQECSACGHIDSNNRLEQSVFRCTACNHTENADLNASKVIKGRGIQVLVKHLEAVIAGTVVAKVKKTVNVRGTKESKKSPKVGQVVPEPVTQTEQPKLVARQGDLLGQSASDAANDPFVQSAMLVETRNPRLGLRSGGG